MYLHDICTVTILTLFTTQPWVMLAMISEFWCLVWFFKYHEQWYMWKWNIVIYVPQNNTLLSTHVTCVPVWKTMVWWKLLWERELPLVIDWSCFCFFSFLSLKNGIYSTVCQLVLVGCLLRNSHLLWHFVQISAVYSSYFY